MAYYGVPHQNGWDYIIPNESYREILSRRQEAVSITIGDEAAAYEKLIKNREEYLKQEQYRFPVHKITIFRTREYLTTCDLANEPDNDDVLYGIYNVMSNEHVRAQGKADALYQHKLSQDQFLANLRMDRYETLIFIPID